LGQEAGGRASTYVGPIIVDSRNASLARSFSLRSKFPNRQSNSNSVVKPLVIDASFAKRLMTNNGLLW